LRARGKGRTIKERGKAMTWSDAERAAWRENRAAWRAARAARREENRAAWAERGLERLTAKVKARDWGRAIHDLDDLRFTLAKLAAEGDVQGQGGGQGEDHDKPENVAL